VADVIAKTSNVSETLMVDLAEYSTEIFDQANSALVKLSRELARCNILIVASPTYKATYTGLLKAFFDRYDNNGLLDVIGVPVMVGAAAVHAMAPELYLRPLLVELGATVPSRALFVLESQIDRLDDVISGWAANAMPLIMAAINGRAVAHQN
jgi:FMN reductase